VGGLKSSFGPSTNSLNTSSSDVGRYLLMRSLSFSSRRVTRSLFLRRSVSCCLVGGSPEVLSASTLVSVDRLLFRCRSVAGSVGLLGCDESWARRRRCRIRRYPADSATLSSSRLEAVLLSGFVVLVLRGPAIALGVRLLTSVGLCLLSAPVWSGRRNLALCWPRVSRSVVSRRVGLLAAFVSVCMPRERRMGESLLRTARCWGPLGSSGHT
jgi:hypothetical protein